MSARRRVAQIIISLIALGSLRTAWDILPALNSFNDQIRASNSGQQQENIFSNVKGLVSAPTEGTLGKPSIIPLPDLSPISMKTTPNKPILNTCYGISSLHSPNNTHPKYLIFYPRAGMGNVLVSYVSSAIYSCLTGRILKIAPYESRERNIFDCNAYYNSTMPGSICQDLEMDKELTAKYKLSKTVVKNPEAWVIKHCNGNALHLKYFLCDDGVSDDEFIAVSSCQYWADLFYSSPYFKNIIPPNAFKEVVQAKLAPSAAVKEKMVRDGPYEVCIHVRWDLEKTKQTLGKDWVTNLGTCVRNILSRQNSNAKNEVMLFTMHKNVRDAVKQNLENGDNQYIVHFASNVVPEGNLGLSNDKYAGIADMFSMGHSCVNLLASREASTYLTISANLMNATRVFPGQSWTEGCFENAELTELNPIGDYWVDDVCKLQGYQCPAKNTLEDARNPSNSHIETSIQAADAQTEKIIPTKDIPSAKTVGKPGQDDKCRRMFEWSMIDQWSTDGKGFDLNRLPQSKTLRKSRMGGPSADGTVDMKILVRNSQLNLTAVDLTKPMINLKHANVWHQHTALYSTWVGVQVARRKYGLVTNSTVYVHDCRGELPIEWQNLGELSCDRSLITQADVMISPPVGGLMWDLAWDFNFECRDSEMFQAYASLFVDKSAKLVPTKPMGCFISRKGANVRTVSNLDAVLGMMHEVFPRVEEIVFTPTVVNQTVDMIRECRVLFGIHGAGHTNALYARPGVGVVEAIGKDRPAYYRNINMLLGQYYQSIVGDRTKKITANGDWVIDLDEARAALVKANDHAAAWIKEHGHWRR